MVKQKAAIKYLRILFGFFLIWVLQQQVAVSWAEQNNEHGLSLPKLPIDTLVKDPYIENIEPSSGAPNIKVTIVGKKLGTPWIPIGGLVSYPGQVKFGSSNAKVINWEDNKITVIVPEHYVSHQSNKTVNVIIKCSFNQKSNSIPFEYIKPKIYHEHKKSCTNYAVLPCYGLPGTTVTIFGENFGEERGRSYVKFGNSHVRKYHKWSDTEIVVSVPDDYGIGVEDAKRVMEFFQLLFSLRKLESDLDSVISLIEIDTPDSEPKLKIELNEEDPWWKSLGKIMTALGVPGVEVVPEELGRDGYIQVAVKVKTSAGDSVGLFRYGLPEVIIPSGSHVAIVMDVSGSMKKKGKLKSAKDAANSFIDLSSEEDRVALVSFSTTARSVVKLLPVTLGKNELQRGVHSLTAGGNTDIGAGLKVGLSQLFSDSKPPINTIIILLSDGKNETGDLWPAVKKCRQKGVKIYTVPFGKDADYEILQKIAQETDGRVSTADVKNLSYVYHRINSQIQNRSTLFAGNDILKPKQQLSYSAIVDPDVSKLTFFTSWQGSSVLMEITDPAGKKIIPGSSIGRYIEKPTYSIFEIDSQPGQWQMRIEGNDFPAGGEQVNISISGKSSLYANFFTFHPKYSLGSKVPIAVEVAEVQGLERTHLTDLKVTAQIRKPPVAIAQKTKKGMKIDLGGILKSAIEKREVTLPLYGNSDYSKHRIKPQANFGCAATSTPVRTYEHPDIPGMKDDGVFANTFHDTNVKGSYLVNVTIEGELENGQQIKRQIIESFQVGPIEDNTVTLSDFLRLGR